MSGGMMGGMGSNALQDFAPYFQAIVGAQSAERRNAQQEALFYKAQNFERYMSGSAYQRATEDLRAAGLNPMLAYSNGGASTPSVGTPAMEDVIGPAMSSAVQTKMAMTQMEQMKATIDNLSEQNKKIVADVANTAADTEKKKQETSTAKQAERNLQVQNKLMQADVPAAQNRARVEETWYGQGMKYIRHFLESVGGIFKGAPQPSQPGR